MPARRRFLAPRLALVLGVSLAGATLVAQQGSAPPSAELPAMPVDQEPRHHVVFANDFVRIIDATLPPFYVSARHSHAADNVAVIVQMLAPQGQSRVGFASFARGGYSHIITNPATTAMRFIDVELRSADRSPDMADPAELPGHDTVLSNARVRVSRVTLEKGVDLPEHQHANGYVSVVVRGREGAGVWKWHPAGEAAATLSPGAQLLELVEIEPR
jgi:hypothetical protein